MKDLRAIARRIERLEGMEPSVAYLVHKSATERQQRIARLLHEGHPAMCRIFGVEPPA